MATDVKTASLGNDWNDHEKLEINPKDVLDVMSVDFPWIVNETPNQKQFRLGFAQSE